jgi:hypothetical protein
MAELQRQLGRMEEAMARAPEDRNEIKNAITELREVVGELRGAVAGLDQTMKSTSSQVLALNQENCGKRLDVMEAKWKHYEVIFGTARTFAWRAISYLCLAAVAGGAGTKFIEFIVK